MKFFLILALAIQTCCSLSTGQSAYEESLPMLWNSKLVYALADILEQQRSGKVHMKFPPEIPQDMLTRFKTESIDFRNFTGDGNGMPFTLISKVLRQNIDIVKNIRSDDGDGDYIESILDKLDERERADPGSNSYFLETFRSIKSKRQCVYGIVKDTDTKKIVITFRGSLVPGQNRDWQSNFNSFMVPMTTPDLLKNKLEGELKDHLYVHKGFYEYLFDNKEIQSGKQRYDKILSDLEPLVQDGYKVWVTGHSLGAALSSMVAFKLAGSAKEWIPKPITCVSYASPFTGSDGYRIAFEQLEKDGLVRYLRFNNNNDPIPSSPPALSFKRFKHVGLNIRLYDNKIEMHHSSNTSWRNVFQNSLIKPLWSTLTMHGLPLHEKRLNDNADVLNGLTIEDLYREKTNIMTAGSSKDEL